MRIAANLLEINPIQMCRGTTNHQIFHGEELLTDKAVLQIQRVAAMQQSNVLNRDEHFMTGPKAVICNNDNASNNCMEQWNNAAMRMLEHTGAY